MFAHARHRYRSPSLLEGGDPRRVCVARERGATYDTAGGDGPPDDRSWSPATAAMAQLDAALHALAGVDWTGESNESVRDAAVALQRRANRLTAQSLRPIREVATRD